MTTFDITAFGAIADGATLATTAVQAAIDAAHAARGGTVRVAAGAYLIGTIRLKSFVHLRIEAGAELRGSTRIADYATDTHKNMYKDEPHMDRCLVFAEHATDISIEGPGKIDGQGMAFPEQGDPANNRPMLIRFLECKRLSLTNIALNHPAAWTSAWLYCDDIRVDGIRIWSRANHNGDGLDFDGCTNVRVSNSTFDTSDDAICLQTSRSDRPVRDVTITNCTFTAYWAGVRIGLMSRADFSEVAITNCVFHDHLDSGLKIQMCEGAAMRNMVFSNLVMRNVPRPVFMTLGQQRACVDAPPSLPPVGTMRSFIFSNITVETLTAGVDAGFVFTGVPDHRIEDVTLSNIRARFAGGGTAQHAEGVPAELTPEVLGNWWPEYTRLGVPVPAYGLYARHVEGLALYNVDFSTAEPDARQPIVIDDVT